MAVFVRIATGHDAASLAMVIGRMEGAGFTIRSAGQYVNAVLPNLGGAVGPVTIMVPESEAPDAIAFLRAIAEDQVEVLDQPEYLPGQGGDSPHDAAARRGWFGRFWARLFLSVGAEHPVPKPSQSRGNDRSDE